MDIEDAVTKTEMWSALDSMGGIQKAMEREETFWATKDGLKAAKDFTAIKPKRLSNTNELIVLNVMCMALIEEGKTSGNGIPTIFSMGEDKAKMSIQGFMTSLYYQEGLAEGLKGKQMLDFVFEKMKRQYKFCKEVINAHANPEGPPNGKFRTTSEGPH